MRHTQFARAEARVVDFWSGSERERRHVLKYLRFLGFDSQEVSHSVTDAPKQRGVACGYIAANIFAQLSKTDTWDIDYSLAHDPIVVQSGNSILKEFYADRLTELRQLYANATSRARRNSLDSKICEATVQFEKFERLCNRPPRADASVFLFTEQVQRLCVVWAGNENCAPSGINSLDGSLRAFVGDVHYSSPHTTPEENEEPSPPIVNAPWSDLRVRICNTDWSHQKGQHWFVIAYRLQF